jgi:integrative and conjugative element protein (TIGR02256 family)
MKVLVRLYRSALALMLQEVAAWPGVETGGVLVGSVDDDYYAAALHGYDHAVTVVVATDSGPSADRRPRYFARDTNHCQARLNQVFARSGAVYDYVGEWHRHCSGSANYSAQDEAALEAVVGSASYGQPRAVSLILAAPNDADLSDRQLVVWFWDYEDRQPRQATVEVLEEDYKEVTA